MAEAVLVAGVLGALMAWRGYRRGAGAVLLGWLPVLCGMAVFGAAMRIAWNVPDHVAAIGLLAVLGALLAYAAIRKAVRPLRLKLHHRDEAAWRPSWRSLPDRLAGAALGLVHSSALCLSGALLVSLGSFVVAARCPAASRPQAEAHDTGRAGKRTESALLAWFRKSSHDVAEVATRSTLGHIPHVAGCAGEVKALIAILNASPQDHDRLVCELDLERLVNLPPVKRAAADDDYLDLIDRLRIGHVTALYRLARHRRTEELMACPEVRDLARRLKPSALARLLEPPVGYRKP
jgi:hypothetical protein